jgi:hypothetical protein
MLLKNPLYPPTPPRDASRLPVAAERKPAPFISPEDFDVTGVLAGMDCSESRYWWMPELHADIAAADQPRLATHAASPYGDDDRRQAAGRAADLANAAA